MTIQRLTSKDNQILKRIKLIASESRRAPQDLVLAEGLLRWQLRAQHLRGELLRRAAAQEVVDCDIAHLQEHQIDETLGA